MAPPIKVKDRKTLDGFKKFAFDNGVFARPFLDYMYTMVPYVINDDELMQIICVMKKRFEK